MGLDINYGANAVAVDNPVTDAGEFDYDKFDEMYGDDPDVLNVYPFPDFPRFTARAEGLKGGYRVTDRGRFCAGSYSGYNRWRDSLSRRALGIDQTTVHKEHERFVGQPFFEIIDFADNEGVIGPKVCAKLAADFRDNRERVLAAAPDDGLGLWFSQNYDNFAKAFEVGSRGGFVEFC